LCASELPSWVTYREPAGRPLAEKWVVSKLADNP
jgi:hypothetical protein